MLTRCYTPPAWARKERDRLAKRMALPSDSSSRALAIAVFGCAAIAVLAGILS